MCIQSGNLLLKKVKEKSEFQDLITATQCVLCNDFFHLWFLVYPAHSILSIHSPSLYE